jgi:hypothetical protein
MLLEDENRVNKSKQMKDGCLDFIPLFIVLVKCNLTKLHKNRKTAAAASFNGLGAFNEYKKLWESPQWNK